MVGLLPLHSAVIPLPTSLAVIPLPSISFFTDFGLAYVQNPSVLNSRAKLSGAHQTFVNHEGRYGNDIF